MSGTGMDESKSGSPSPLLLRKSVRDSVKSCKNCPLVDGCKSPVPFAGPSPSRIAVIGEAPGRYEDIQGRPFIGPSGQLARTWMERVGVNPDDIAWLNVVSCYPRRTPTGREVEACRGNVRRQLGIINPDFVLVVGGVATSAWHPLLRIGDLRGRWWDMERSTVPGGDDTDEGEWQGALALATWHPAAVLRNRGLYPQALQDVTYFAMVARGEVGCVFSDRCVMCGDEYDKVDKGIAWCQKHWDQKHGVSGRGRKGPRFRKTTVKDRRLIEVDDG